MRKIYIKKAIIDEKDIYMMLNDHKQGFIMCLGTPIAYVGYNDSTLGGMKKGWHFELTNFDVIRPDYKTLEDVFKAVWKFIDDDFEPESYLRSAFDSRFWPKRQVENGYDRVTYIDGKLEVTRMPDTVWVGTRIYENIPSDISPAQDRLKSKAVDMIHHNIEALHEVMAELRGVTYKDICVDGYRDIEAINAGIANNIKNIQNAILNLKY